MDQICKYAVCDCMCVSHFLKFLLRRFASISLYTRGLCWQVSDTLPEKDVENNLFVDGPFSASSIIILGSAACIYIFFFNNAT